jgi:hypothetical protein
MNFDKNAQAKYTPFFRKNFEFLRRLSDLEHFLATYGG